MKSGIRTFEQLAFSKLSEFDNEEFFERFKNTEYTYNDFKSDYDSMIKTVNTPNYE